MDQAELNLTFQIRFSPRTVGVHEISLTICALPSAPMQVSHESRQFSPQALRSNANCYYMASSDDLSSACFQTNVLLRATASRPLVQVNAWLECFFDSL